MTATLNETIRVVIVDDSATIRTILSALFGEIPTISVCGMAENGAEAAALGVAGYITKDQRPSKLVKAVLAAGSPVPDSSGNSTAGSTP